jgi:outer membrane protein
MNVWKAMPGMLAIGLVACGARAADLKVAVVDASRLLKEYHKTELAESHMQAQVENFSAERDKLLAEHKRLKGEFEALRAEGQNKALSDEARDKKKEQAEDKLSEVIKYEDSIRDKALNRRKQLEGESRRMQVELVKAIRAAVRTCAEKDGYTLVLDTSGLLANGFESVLFSDGKLDITDEVLKVLNAEKPAKDESAKPAKGADEPAKAAVPPPAKE